MPYIIDSSGGHHRDQIEKLIVGLDLLQPETREKAVTAWVSMWVSGPFKDRDFADIPWGEIDIGYTLLAHVNEVTRIGLDLGRIAEREWGHVLDPEIYNSILILHDVDKPLLYTNDSKGVGTTPLYDQLPHGVPGAMLLKELGFPLTVIHTVATHSPRMPFQGRNPEAMLLHYADMLAADHAWARSGRKPLFFNYATPLR